MSFKVKIEQADDPITVEMGETILQAALRQGIKYPCGCQAGNCGACKSALISGEIEMSPWSEYALSPEEEREGRILACRAVPWSDAEVRWLDPAERRMVRKRRASEPVEDPA
ncbi:2Fe-2S iron-sulfur cluster-binding protein [Minwuia sp.]|uniref:2Fe-2S iron-sulfur cluster-binding protein n=1 Tax=Minwuia sp. TaxID=2493630 RepID=UPI003A8D9602